MDKMFEYQLAGYITLECEQFEGLMDIYDCSLH
jgi:hypothetical protein